MPDDNRVGVLIQRARQRKRLTQQELADQLGVSKSAVANWEIGKHFPVRHAGAVEDVLDITLPEPEPEAAAS